MNEEEKNLGQRKSSAPYAIVAGIIFALDALRSLRALINYYTFFAVLEIIAFAILAFSFITKQKNFLPAAGFGIMSVNWLIDLVRVFERLSPISKILHILSILGYLLAALICLANLTDMLPQLKKPLSGLWFVPSILIFCRSLYFFVSILADTLKYFDVGYFFRSLWNLLLGLLFALGDLFALLWTTHPDGLRTAAPASASYSQPDGTPGQAPDVMPEAYCGMAKHILLLLFTFGIWPLIWVYRMTRYTNAVQDEPERNPTTKLLLCMFIPFYSIYWTYKTAQRIDKMAAAKSVSSDIATLCLILEFFIPIVPMILMQDKLNSVVTARSVPPQAPQYSQPQAPQYSQPQEAAYAQPQTASSVADELKTYKDLLDSGILTQEEFDAKKKQLLGL